MSRSTLWSLLSGAALGLLLLVVAGAVVLTHLSYGFYIVHTGSMDPTYRPGDLVVDRANHPYAVGDVITFEHGAGPADLITHRIIRVTSAGISTKGDGNRSADTWTIRPDQVHGTVTGALPHMGFVAYYLKQPAGVGSLLTAMLSWALLWGLFFPSRGELLDEAASDRRVVPCPAPAPPSTTIPAVPRPRAPVDDLEPAQPS